ncbi:uncharacterized protein LOC126837358 isoform X2 [Adelges cooleyi]|uniref:uncharacterized protein LOC126837358 isoform X1 n=1 Tax=Adelges cooleyi TaxID=133065 RepID=UPI0021801677|nr:uncharacterized protein LOC126837358 isoform X1 [Adelges cooleyi]XP_050427206.1 uncharacterized protein LOC126837358 isoform X2 [Adelges cooleyi]
MYSKIMMLFICIAWYVLQCQCAGQGPSESQLAVIVRKVDEIYHEPNGIYYDDFFEALHSIKVVTRATGNIPSLDEFLKTLEDREYTLTDCLNIVRFIVGDDTQQAYAEALFKRNGNTSTINFVQLSVVTYGIRFQRNMDISIHKEDQLKAALLKYTFPIQTKEDAIRTIIQNLNFAVLK